MANIYLDFHVEKHIFGRDVELGDRKWELLNENGNVQYWFVPDEPIQILVKAHSNNLASVQSLLHEMNARGLLPEILQTMVDESPFGMGIIARFLLGDRNVVATFCQTAIYVVKKKGKHGH